MNERIRELAEEVYGSAHYDDFKFAELIVWECLALGKMTQLQAVKRNRSEAYNTGREMGIEVFMNQIKQNFGIEL
jgi:hypothetical protein